jgi:hypothetical protein
VHSECTQAVRPDFPAAGALVAGLSGLIVLATACGGGGSGGQACASGSCPTERTVASAFTTTYAPSGGARTTVTVPQPAGSTVAALVPDGSAQGYRVFPGTLAADGTFSIPGVPVGSYLLRTDRPDHAYYLDASLNMVNVDFIRTDVTEFTTSAPSLEWLVGARPDVVYSTSATATLNFSNLDPWASGHQLFLASPSAGLDSYSYQWSAPPPAGATSHAARLDWAWIGGGLPDAAKGDVVYAYQRASTIQGTVLTRLTTKYARLTDMSFSGGVATENVPLVAAPLSESLPIDLRTTRFAALLPDLGPALSADATTLTIGVYAVQSSNAYPAPMETAMRYLFVIASAQGADLNLGSQAYGGFGEAAWKRFRRTGMSYSTRLLPPAGSVFTAYGTLYSDEPLPGASTPLAPVLGPVRAPLVNGRDALTTNLGVGLQPTFSWSPPILGSATAYIVRIVPAYDQFSSDLLQARVFGAQSFQLPPGVLKAGASYYALITAAQGPGYERDLSPNLAGIPSHHAEVVTGIFAP